MLECLGYSIVFQMETCSQKDGYKEWEEEKEKIRKSRKEDEKFEEEVQKWTEEDWKSEKENQEWAEEDPIWGEGTMLIRKRRLKQYQEC